MIRRPPRSTQSRSSAASDVYKRQDLADGVVAVDRSRSAAGAVHGHGLVIQHLINSLLEGVLKRYHRRPAFVNVGSGKKRNRECDKTQGRENYQPSHLGPAAPQPPV